MDITHKNPYRYRSYYYDAETGFYYLNARYYDPQIRRFISADSMNALMLATTDVGCKNLFCYAENNPVTNKDGSGNFVDTIFDVISLAGSIADVCKKPNDPMAWACLVGDAMDVLIPGVAGIGEVIRGAKTVAIAAGAAEAAVGVAKGATKLSKKIDNLVDGAKSLGKKAAKSSSQTKAKGWKVGESIDNLTKAGKEPSWSTVKSRYWKNEAYNNLDLYSNKNLELMKKGNAPRHTTLDVSKELHHINGRNIDNPHNINNLRAVWPWEHAEIDPYRYYTGPRP